ncbi:uncharacterized protein K452DRAFT_303679 [Aplosporella prunicola CBS 121167]|uniref:DUF6604 domain-containing protein n=1 Tax=Aplosporella prunicola CBS 121167 TaxID=1176127 RepID=A0A6A6AU77_9PEZI|nr:uncharacterized protein K452DRAFT_303679 [Aplosporella prunicola CBS 121167]KAF2135250.1 hypothetical protein K452DRAFT_303679 [Aplosporella prunicola CBS 121167]
MTHEEQDSTPSQTPVHTIAVHDFIDLADYIVSANAKTPVAVPNHIWNALDSAISLRKDSTARFSSIPSSSLDDIESNSRHTHFITILEHVRKTLRARISSATQDNRPAKKDSSGKTTTSDITFVNTFAGLHVEEPSESFLKAPNALPTQTEPNYSAELHEDFREA